MALNGPARSGRRCPLIGAKRTSPYQRPTSQFDPQRTWCDYRKNRLGGTAHKNTIRLVGGLRAQHNGLGGNYSITSSARLRIDGGTVRPRVLAVFRLTTSSKMADCWTGKSAGLA